jgi:phosphatidylserine/phosphatidylglycerophosphate/cardiolipin synthase-like enzyme
MRSSNTVNNLKVNAIAGTYVVVLGFDLPQADCVGLLGFSIRRIDHVENDERYLEGMKAFAETDPGFPAGSLYSTKDHPIQGFQWADYAAKPGYNYTYTVTALKGTPQVLVPFVSTSVQITTESPENGNHNVYFNRGVAASQEYVRRFGDRSPRDVPQDRAFEWLSRGLYEALVSFITSSVAGTNSLRMAAYEFNYEPLLKVITDTINTGVDIQIVYDARKAVPGDRNNEMVNKYNLSANSIKRTEGKSYISHNKFIVKLENGNPISVWTGGTNFSEGGIFGHSNVAHVVEDVGVATQFLTYWNELANDPKTEDLRDTVEQLSPLPQIPVPQNSTVVFSPRQDLTALDLYASLGSAATNGLFMTFAFGINNKFKAVYQNGQANFRLALLEAATRPMENGPEKEAEIARVQALRNMPENVFAIGDFIRTNKFDGWVKEKLSGMNSHVKYVHNKFMLVNPLSKDPVVVAGSANFSDASTSNNDENMLVVRGNTRIADIYLGEFMRLFSHHSFRESLKFRRPDQPPKPLDSTDSWCNDNFGNTPRSTRRSFFAQNIV